MARPRVPFKMRSRVAFVQGQKTLHGVICFVLAPYETPPDRFGIAGKPRAERSYIVNVGAIQGVAGRKYWPLVRKLVLED